MPNPERRSIPMFFLLPDGIQGNCLISPALETLHAPHGAKMEVTLYLIYEMNQRARNRQRKIWARKPQIKRAIAEGIMGFDSNGDLVWKLGAKQNMKGTE